MPYEFDPRPFRLWYDKAMVFRTEDWRPNRPMSLDQVRAGSTSDARWREVPEGVDRIDAALARPPLPNYGVIFGRKQQR